MAFAMLSKPWYPGAMSTPVLSEADWARLGP
jgi:hypothetical protein